MSMQKNFLILPLILSGILSSCATYDDFLTENKGGEHHENISEPDGKLTREQRESIMSGQKPDVSTKKGREVTIPIFRW
ncbi:hypothetical protein VPX56_00635 [Enterobacter wuhouensis]|uniref:Lipoprotein n=1 Tax=Enterobacter wuhouensis TaxID=2529381 RepID=A0ABZ1DHL0_9ENTR|nr:hypothetical protein [Enterobacter wuhouensis]WRW31677.1 hypothetical protein VPX56_00635 [Enterobacter wuhouensis]